jgi:hypothetical protein
MIMKKLMVLVAVFMLGATGITFAQEPVKKDKPVTEQTEDKKEEAKEATEAEAKKESKEEPKEEPQTEKSATEKEATEAQDAK